MSASAYPVNERKTNVTSTFYFNLANEMEKKKRTCSGITRKEQSHLGFCLSNLIKTIADTFCRILKHQENLHPFAGGSTLVLGADGHGKSTFIGYQIGARLVKTTHIHRRGTVLDYECPQENYPQIGHIESTTIVYRAYQRYIDTGSITTVSGEERERFLNVWTLQLAIEKLTPKRVVFVVDRNVFTSSNPEGMVEKIYKEMMSVLRNPLDPHVLSSVLILVNPKDSETTTNEDINDSIDYAIHYLKRDLKQDRQWFEFDEEDLEIEEPAIDTIDVQSAPLPTEPGKILEIHRKMYPTSIWNKSLSFIHALRDQIIVEDFTTDETREKVKEWENRTGSLSPQDFVVKEAFSRQLKDIRDTVLALTVYFNELAEEKETEKLQSYTKFLNLFTRAITEFNLTLFENEEEKVEYSRFIENFP